MRGAVYWVAGEYRAGRSSKPDPRRLPGIETRTALEDFLKAHGIDLPMTLEEPERDPRDLDRIGVSVSIEGIGPYPRGNPYLGHALEFESAKEFNADK